MFYLCNMEQNCNTKTIKLHEFKARRKALGLSMDEVAGNANVSKSTISRLENGLDILFSNVKAINDFYLSRGV